MARTRMEDSKSMEYEAPQVVTDFNDVPMVEIPKNIKTETPKAASVQKADDDYNEPVSCLRNERVIVRFIPRPNTMVNNPKHVLYGGMSEDAVRKFVVPKLSSTGLYVNVLTNNEMHFLEQAMGLEKGTLSIYKKTDNFWDDSNPNGIGRVVLHKQDNYLDLSIPEDYIKYKVLLANKNLIAKSLQDMEDHPKATYQFVIISENAEASSKLNRMDMTMECYTEYGAVRNDVDTLKTVIELFEGRPVAPRVKLDYLQGKVNEYIQSNPRRFLQTIKDELLPLKVLIKRCVENGLISMRNNLYYLREDGSPLCELGEDSTLNNAARYIGSVKRQELKYQLEAKLKQ